MPLLLSNESVTMDYFLSDVIINEKPKFYTFGLQKRNLRNIRADKSFELCFIKTM